MLSHIEEILIIFIKSDEIPNYLLIRDLYAQCLSSKQTFGTKVGMFLVRLSFLLVSFSF